jgi:hypothetical protein
MRSFLTERYAEAKLYGASMECEEYYSPETMVLADFDRHPAFSPRSGRERKSKKSKE